MKVFGTLLTTSQNPHSRRLLSAGLRDRPRPSSFTATAAALGMVADAAVAAAASAAGSVTGGETVAGATKLATSQSAAPLGLAVVKWLGVGMVAGTLSTAALSALAPHAPNTAIRAKPTPPRSSRGTSSGPAASARPDSPPVSSSVPAVPREGAPRVQRSSEAPNPMTTSESSTNGFVTDDVGRPQNDGQLAREAALVDRARGELALGNREAASRLLRDYQNIRRVGALDREVQFLSIDIAVQKQDRARAIVLATEFERTFPGDSYLPRIQRLIANVPP